MTPEAQHHTTANIVTTEPVQILVGQQSSDLWHQVLNALWDDGIIAGLPDDAYRVLGAYLRIRHSESGLATATAGQLMQMVGRGRSYVYRGRQRLLDHDRRLLEARPELNRDTYAVLPGWSFRKRGQESANADGAVRHGGRFSAIADLSKVSKTPENEIIVEEDDERIEMLTREATDRVGGPFRRPAARGLITSTAATQADVDAACRNASRLARHPDPSKRLRDWRAYIAKQLTQGVTLNMADQQLDDDRRRNWEIVTRLLAQAGDTEHARAVADWWNDLGPEQQGKALGAYERGRTDEWIWGAMVAKASRLARR